MVGGQFFIDCQSSNPFLTLRLTSSLALAQAARALEGLAPTFIFKAFHSEIAAELPEIRSVQALTEGSKTYMMVIVILIGIAMAMIVPILCLWSAACLGICHHLGLRRLKVDPHLTQLLIRSILQLFKISFVELTQGEGRKALYPLGSCAFYWWVWTLFAFPLHPTSYGLRRNDSGSPARLVCLGRCPRRTAGRVRLPVHLTNNGPSHHSTSVSNKDYDIENVAGWSFQTWFFQLQDLVTVPNSWNSSLKRVCGI